MSRYPELANLKSRPNVNIISRNVFARCESVFIRDGGVEEAALDAVVDGAVGMQIAARGRASGDSSLLKAVLFEPIPVGEIGPYESN